MSISNKNDRKVKVKRVIEILRFILTLDDEEIMRSSIETVIEMLEELD